jgi:hypothetical protein
MAAKKTKKKATSPTSLYPAMARHYASSFRLMMYIQEFYMASDRARIYHCNRRLETLQLVDALQSSLDRICAEITYSITTRLLIREL